MSIFTIRNTCLALATLFGLSAFGAETAAPLLPFYANCKSSGEDGPNLYLFGNLVKHEIVTTGGNLYHILQYRIFEKKSVVSLNPKCLSKYVSIKNVPGEKCQPVFNDFKYVCDASTNALEYSLNPGGPLITLSCVAGTWVEEGSTANDVNLFLTRRGVIQSPVELTLENKVVVTARQSSMTVADPACLNFKE